MIFKQELMKQAYQFLTILFITELVFLYDYGKTVTMV